MSSYLFTVSTNCKEVITLSKQWGMLTQQKPIQTVIRKPKEYVSGIEVGLVEEPSSAVDGRDPTSELGGKSPGEKSKHLLRAGPCQSKLLPSKTTESENLTAVWLNYQLNIFLISVNIWLEL